MSFATFYRLSSSGLIAAAFLAVAIAGVLSPVLILLPGCLIIASWFLDTARVRQLLPEWAWRSIILSYLPIYFLDYRYLSKSLLLSTLHLLIFLLVLRLITHDEDRAFLHELLACCGSLLIAAALTTELIFVICLMLFVTFAAGSLLLFDMKRCGADALKSGAIQPVVVSERLKGTGYELYTGFPSATAVALTLVLAAAVILLAVPFFFLFPRAFPGVSFPPSGHPVALSGFSETVALGAIGRIKESGEPVMKVRVDSAPARLPPDLKWRGIALDRFDGRSWSRSSKERFRIPTQAGFFKLQEYTQGPELLVQTFLLEPIVTDVVFGSHRMLAVSGDLGWLERDASENVFSRTPRDAQVRYSVVSDITRLDPLHIAGSHGPPPDDIRACCLQLPAIDPRIGVLANRVTESADTPYEKALLLEAHLRSAYGYSLDLKGTPDHPDPVAMFLFDIRRGHCEYFASAMAVMLRRLGIPSRLINGFRSGEYNRLSGHWTVRQYNAHSWVEAWFAGVGWVAFDPTPGEPEGRRSFFLQAAAGVFDALDLWWTDDVVNYDLRKQSSLLRTGFTTLRDYGNAARAATVQAGGSIRNGLARPHSGSRAICGITLACLLVLAFVFKGGLRRGLSRVRRALPISGGGRSEARRRSAIAGIYEEALILLRRRGLERGGSQTPREFARQQAGAPFGGDLLSLTDIYNRVRFGSRTEEEDLARARSLLRAIRYHP